MFFLQLKWLNQFGVYFWSENQFWLKGTDWEKIGLVMELHISDYPVQVTKRLSLRFYISHILSGTVWPSIVRGNVTYQQ